MTILLVQTFLLLLGAFLLGASLACLFRRAISGRSTVDEPVLSPGLAAAAAAAPVVAAGDADRFGRALTGGHEAAPALQPTGPVVEVQPRPPVRVSPLIEPVETVPASVAAELEPEPESEPLPPEPVVETAPEPVYEAPSDAAPETEPEAERPAEESYTQVALAVAAGTAAAAAARAMESTRADETPVEDSVAEEPPSDERESYESYVSESGEQEALADAPSYAEIAAAAALERATAEDAAAAENVEEAHPEIAAEDHAAADASASSDDDAGRSYTEVAVGAASGLAAAAVTAAIADDEEREPEASDETGDTADSADTAESASSEFDTPETDAVAPLLADVPAGDDFTRIHTIDTTLRDRLHNLGMTRFADVGGWSASDVMRFSQALGVVPGRIEQENWVGQAQILAGGGVTDYPRWRGSEDTPRAAAPADAERLNRIIGIDPESEGVLRDNGVTSLADIAAWNDDDVALFEDVLGTPGRIGRENWVEQARFLTRGSGVAGAIESIGAAAAAATAAVVVVAASDETPPADEEQDAVEDVASAEEQPLAHEASLAESVEPEGSDDTGAEASSDAPGARGEGYAGLRSVRSEALVGGAGYALPPVGSVDDLKRIRGIGVLIEKKLHSLGITSYEQVANWTGEDIDRISQLLDFKGRIERENWIEQARILASGGQTEFSRRVDRGEA